MSPAGASAVGGVDSSLPSAYTWAASDPTEGFAAPSTTAPSTTAAGGLVVAAAASGELVGDGDNPAPEEERPADLE